MARFLANRKLLAAAAVDALSLSIFRRGYVAGAQQASLSGFGKGSPSGSMVGKAEERSVSSKEEAGSSSAWAPDPIKGYYRPANCSAEIDPVELREMLLNHRVRPQ